LIAPLVFLITLHVLTDLPLLLTRAIWGSEPPVPIHLLQNGIAIFGFSVAILAVFVFWRHFKAFARGLAQK
jgi:hypothetical protein